MSVPTVRPTDPVAINAVLVAARQPIDEVCDRWSLTLIDALLNGGARFGELLERTGMANRLLVARLRSLTDVAVIEVEQDSTSGYKLTPKGEALRDVLSHMAAWDAAWSATPSIALDLRCRACDAPATARDIELRLSTDQLQVMPGKQRSRRRSRISGRKAPDTDSLGGSLDLFGDKWSLEILLCAFFGLARFNAVRRHTGISTNILADRLERLTRAGVIRPDEAGYRLTPKGIDLYGAITAVQDWADAWLQPRQASPLALVHRACGAVFHPVLGPGLD